jgi:hypothetical protein
VSLDPKRTQEFQVIRDNVIQEICKVVTAECDAVLGDTAVSLILTGSAAREEATIMNSGNGWKLLGDAEFLVVARKSAGSGDDSSVARIMHESAKKLLSLGIEAAIDIAIVRESYLKNLPPYIFSYELRTCGRVISGDPKALQSIPTFSARDISREDAWRLLCNRMIEQLALVDEAEKASEMLPPRLHYAMVKLYLDMATSYLVFAGSYAPTYRERAARLLELAAKQSIEAPFPLKKFATRVGECTSWKISGSEADCDRSPELWHEAISYMRRLWRWEMIQLTKASGELTIAALSARFAKQQSVKQGIRGWMSLAKRQGWLTSCTRWPRWLRLAIRSTPRNLVYQAAAEVAFRLPCLVKHGDKPPRLDVNWRKIQALLPERAPRSNASRTPAWRGLVDDVLWNYSRYLQNTRA